MTKPIQSSRVSGSSNNKHHNKMLQPQEMDVLVGRGCSFLEHQGNLYFKSLIQQDSHLKAFFRTTDRRKEVALQIVETVQRQGRFLEVAAGSAWQVIHDVPRLVSIVSNSFYNERRRRQKGIRPVPPTSTTANDKEILTSTTKNKRPLQAIQLNHQDGLHQQQNKKNRKEEFVVTAPKQPRETVQTVAAPPPPLPVTLHSQPPKPRARGRRECPKKKRKKLVCYEFPRNAIYEDAPPSLTPPSKKQEDPHAFVWVEIDTPSDLEAARILSDMRTSMPLHTQRASY